MYERMKNFIQEINSNYSGKTIVIVSHGCPLWMAKKVIKDFDFENYQEAKKVYPQKE
jgi:broad specificity phosphatase PhoE